MTGTRRASTSFSLKQAFFEAFFVLLGVALAMIANAWWASRQQAERTTIAIAAITSELAANLEAVRASATYHDEKTKMLFAWRGDDPPSPRAFPEGFVRAANVLDAAWKTAQTADALSHVEYETLLTLSVTYADQTRYEEQSRITGSLIYETILAEGIDGLLSNHRNLGTIIATMVYRERQLSERYEATLAALEARTKR